MQACRRTFEMMVWRFADCRCMPFHRCHPGRAAGPRGGIRRTFTRDGPTSVRRVSSVASCVHGLCLRHGCRAGVVDRPTVFPAAFAPLQRSTVTSMSAGRVKPSMSAKPGEQRGMSGNSSNADRGRRFVKRACGLLVETVGEVDRIIPDGAQQYACSTCRVRGCGLDADSDPAGNVGKMVSNLLYCVVGDIIQCVLVLFFCILFYHA